MAEDELLATETVETRGTIDLGTKREPERQIDRFSVTAKIGEGGVGEVFLAHDPQLGRKVAIKLLRSRGEDQRALLRLVREAQGLARVSHPNVVQVYQIGEHDNAVFIAMEYVRGSTLHAWLARKRSWRAIVEMLVQCGRGLEAAHRAALIHRDFKPANVMVGVDGRARVLDFGLARDSRALGGQTGEAPEAEALLQRQITEHDAILGTPAYMAPEQLLEGRCNALSDQFSFCAVAFEALVGRRPVVGRSLAELRARVSAGDIATMPDDGELPRRVCEAISRGLALDPAARWPSMTELLEQLDIAIADLGRQASAGELDEPSPRSSGKLYGRGRELEQLGEAFGAVAERSSSTALLVVRGEAGVGKSALIGELLRSLGERALIGGAKFDQLQGVTPLSGFVEAFEDLAAQLRDESDERIVALREGILAGVGNGAQILVDLVPGLATLLGPQPPAPELGGVERLHRFRRVVERFVAALADPTRPLVLFLDDLQWADPDSLALLEHLLGSPELDALVVVATVRTREPGSTHVEGLLARLPEHVRLAAVDLVALALDDVAALLADALGSSPHEVLELAAVVVEKTGGNPFFVQEFIEILRADHLIAFDTQRRAWTWSMDRIAERPLVEDLLELLAGRLDALPSETRRLLQWAGCIGNRFALASLAAVAGDSPAKTLQTLAPALSQSLIMPVGDVDAAELELRFRHDRIQTAACALLDERERAAAHLEIGRTLLATLDPGRRRARAFELADQLNAGRSLMSAASERHALIELDLDCGRRALHSAAYASACGYLGAAAELLGDHREEPLWFDVHLELARACYLDGRYEAAEAIYPGLLAVAAHDAQRLAVHELRIEHAMLSSSHELGFAACRAAFALYGLELPDRDEAALPLFGAELAAVEQQLAAVGGIEALREVAELEDERDRALLQLLNRFGVLCYRTSRPLLLAWAIAKMTRLSIAGRSPLAGYTYSNFAFLLAIQGDLLRAGAFAKLGLELARDYAEPVMLTRTTIVALGLIGHFEHPLHEIADELHGRFPSCIEAGDLMHASDLLLLGDYAKLASGAPLSAVMADIEHHLGFFRRSAPVPLSSFYVPHLVLLTCTLIDRPLAELGLEFDSEEFLTRYADSAIAQAWYLSALTKLDVLLGRRVPSEELLRRVAIVEAGVTGQMHIPEVRFYAALCLLRSEAPIIESVRERIDEWMAGLQRSASRCPSNYQPKLSLLEAELARVRGDALEQVVARYERALDEAATAGAIDHEALTARAYGEYWLACGLRRSAAVHLQHARELFGRWGATRVVAELDYQGRRLALESASACSSSVTNSRR
jgi:predicted ATPase/predicted Ser/Thr protein kinase